MLASKITKFNTDGLKKRLLSVFCTFSSANYVPCLLHTLLVLCLGSTIKLFSIKNFSIFFVPFTNLIGSNDTTTLKIGHYLISLKLYFKRV